MDYMSDEDVQQFLDEAFPSEASSAEYDTEESTDTSNDESKKSKCCQSKNMFTCVCVYVCMCV